MTNRVGNSRTAHIVTVAKLAELLTQLEPNDLLVPNSVDNLAILRAGTQIGYIDLLQYNAHVELYS